MTLTEPEFSFILGNGLDGAIISEYILLSHQHQNIVEADHGRVPWVQCNLPNNVISLTMEQPAMASHFSRTF